MTSKRYFGIHCFQESVLNAVSKNYSDALVPKTFPRYSVKSQFKTLCSRLVNTVL